jgi:cell wall-associated NlpC family hydrolase
MWYKKYLGIPYKLGGRDEKGLDCWGLIIKIFNEEKKTKLFDIENYDEDWSWKGKDLFMENYEKQWARIKTPFMFDVVLINNGKGMANHAGVYINSKRFIHCIKAGVVMSKTSDTLWHKRIYGYFRFKHD